MTGQVVVQHTDDGLFVQSPVLRGAGSVLVKSIMYQPLASKGHDNIDTAFS